MCIAILVKPGKSLDKEVLERCHKKNPDGCGIAYVKDNGRVCVSKSLDFEKHYKTLRKMEAKYPSSPFLIHYRIATRGVVTTKNCHPFAVNKSMVFMHNGTISSMPNEKELSDTAIFNRDVLKKLPSGWENNPAIKTLVEDFIGYSKLVVLKDDKTYYIFNESKGIWEDDVWYSNTGYKPPVVYAPAVRPVSPQYRYDPANNVMKEYTDYYGNNPAYIQETPVQESCEVCGKRECIAFMETSILGGTIYESCRTCSDYTEQLGLGYSLTQDRTNYYDPDSDVKTTPLNNDTPLWGDNDG